MSSDATARAVKLGLTAERWLYINSGASEYGKAHGESEGLTQAEYEEYLRTLSDLTAEERDIAFRAKYNK